MPDYRRSCIPGATYFFTVVSRERRPFLTLDVARTALHQAIIDTRETLPFRINGWVLLPDHMHCLWTLPEGDADFSTRWSIIKRLTSQTLQDAGVIQKPPICNGAFRRESALWQRRFWEHRIRDEDDYKKHMDYLNWNPVKHGLVSGVQDWPWSTFHRLVKQGYYPGDWGGNYRARETDSFGE